MKVPKSSWNINELKVVIRRVATGLAPFVWELHRGETMIPVRVSQQRFKSMEDAYQAGEFELKTVALSWPSVRPVTSRLRTVTVNLPPLDIEDDDNHNDNLDDKDVVETDYPMDAANGSTATG